MKIRNDNVFLKFPKYKTQVGGPSKVGRIESRSTNDIDDNGISKWFKGDPDQSEESNEKTGENFK